MDPEIKRGNSLNLGISRTDSSENQSNGGSFSSLFRKNSDRFKMSSRNKNLGGTFVGTPLYTAPEMLENN